MTILGKTAKIKFMRMTKWQDMLLKCDAPGEQQTLNGKVVCVSDEKAHSNLSAKCTLSLPRQMLQLEWLCRVWTVDGGHGMKGRGRTEYAGTDGTEYRPAAFAEVNFT